MKFDLVLISLFLILIISGCVGTGTIMTQNIEIKAVATPDSIESGETTTLYFEIANNGDVDLNNTNLKIIDPCLLEAGKIISVAEKYTAVERVTLNEGESYSRTCKVFSEAKQDWIEGDCKLTVQRINPPTARIKLEVIGSIESDCSIGGEITHSGFRAIVRNINSNSVTLETYCKTGEIMIEDVAVTLGDLKPEESAIWEQEFEAKETKFSTNCDVKYEISYDTEIVGMYDIIALSKSEYNKLKREGKSLTETSGFTKTSSQVDMDVSLSGSQPFIENEDFYLYMNFRNVGSGYVKFINVKMEYPNFLELEACDKTLPGQFDFIRAETGRITCKFRVKSVVIKEVGQIYINGNYNYELEDVIGITIEPKI